jgi:hypothetical protein
MEFIKKIIIKAIGTLSPIIRLWERGKLKQFGDQPIAHQPVFIIAAPRTGSTILSQVVTNQLDVLFFNNLNCRLSENLFFAFWLSQKLFKNRSHNCFTSFYGSTLKSGNRAPSECGKFWYRWLPTSHHFVKKGEVSDIDRAQIKREITAITNYYDKPVVFTNNNMGMRIRMLSEIFPNAKFIVSDRNPLNVGQSLLKARKAFYDNYGTWWSIKPRNYSEIKKEQPYDQVVLQHYYINKQIFVDLNEYYVGNYIWVDYSDFCENQKATIAHIAKFMKYEVSRGSFETIVINESKKISIEPDAAVQLKKLIAKLDWNDYTS